MPVFPWRFIDSLLGRSQPDAGEPAGPDYLATLEARIVRRFEADASLAEHLSRDQEASLRYWAGQMVGRRVQSVGGWTQRDADVQMGAVAGAARAVIQIIDEAYAAVSDGRPEQLAWRLRRLDGEIAAPLYPLDEQSIVRARLQVVLDRLAQGSADAVPGALLDELVDALTPPEQA